MSAKHLFELPEERLATTTSSGKRKYLYPAIVSGYFRHLRTKLYYVLIVIFLGLPWITVAGQPLILLDVYHRKFIVFGIQFWAHEAPILVLVFLCFVIGIALITALFGRVWCGFACPQTVFIDAVFSRIESFFEGKGLARKRFDESRVSLKKILIKSAKWACFFLASLVITNSFLAYFVGAERVINMIQHSPLDNMTSFLVVFVSLLIILFNFGWFREQFCIIACPYGRLQSVLMDDDSLVVGYDAKRGEPRKEDAKDNSFTGDCINCYRCVQVCPTGIDIRRGTQMECIMCSACVDACDTVMTKLKKQTGLIRFDSENGLKQQATKLIKNRFWVYLVLLSIVLSALSYSLSHRESVAVFAKRLSNPPYSEINETLIQNHFTLKITNQNFYNILASYDLSDDDIQKGIRLIKPIKRIHIKAGKTDNYSFFIRFPKTLLDQGRQSIQLKQIIQSRSDQVESNQEIIIIGPR